MSESEPESDKILTLEETAEELTVSASTVSRYVKSGELKCYRLGKRKGMRFKMSDIKLFFDNRIVRICGVEES